MRVDNWKLNAICNSNVEYLLCEHWETNGNLSHQFKVYPHQFTVKISAFNVTLSNMKIIWFRINNNRATTGHKLQGM